MMSPSARAQHRRLCARRQETALGDDGFDPGRRIDNADTGRARFRNEDVTQLEVAPADTPGVMTSITIIATSNKAVDIFWQDIFLYNSA